MSKFEVMYNGYKLTDVMRITDIRRSVGNERSVVLNNTGMFGSSVTGVSVGSKVIKIKFSLQGQNLEELKHTLANVFNTSLPAKLTISDEPDKYYLALVTGGVDLENVKRWFQKGELEFLIPDGVAHSTAYKTFQTPTASGTKLTFDLVNNGNVPAYPIIDVNHTSENGYLGFVCVEKDVKSGQPMSSMMEIGSREKVTQTPIQRSTNVLDYKDMTDALRDATVNATVPGLNYSYNGVFYLVAGSNGSKRLSLQPSVFKVQTGSLTWNIPQADVTSEKIAWNMTLYTEYFDYSSSSIWVSVSDSVGAFLYGAEYARVSGGFELRVHVSDGGSGRKMIKAVPVNQGYFGIGNNQNPFSLKGGNVEIARTAQELTLTYPGGTFTAQAPEIKDKKTAKVHLVLDEKRSGTAYVGVHSLTFRRDFTEQPREVPNRYANGSVINIDCEKDRIVVNGLDQTNDLVHGSDFLVIPPGKSTLEIHSSSFATSPPRVEVKFEERWL
ncbi:TPA: distal tail protein Dit [Streptococcus suis]